MATDAQVAANQAKVQANKEKLYQVEGIVLANKQKIYAARAFIEENRAMIMTNYAAAFSGNRFMANHHTEDIFKNRTAILSAIKTETTVQENFRNSKLNEAKVDYLEHRASMNSKVSAVSEKMVAANTLLREINEDIMKGNADIVEFNKRHMDINTKLLSGAAALEEMTADKNAARIASNGARVDEVQKLATANKDKASAALESAKANRDKIEQNKESIYARRAEIEANITQTQANAAKIGGAAR